jgi:pulcherriminic acid synthase
MSTMTSEPPDVLSPEFASDMTASFQRMRDDFPLFQHQPSGYWFISRYDDVQFALNTLSTKHQEWQLEPVIGRSLGGMSGREHSTHRSLVTPAFRGRELGERFAPVIDSCASELIDRFRHDGSVDLVSAFTRWFPINVISTMLGLPKEDHPKFRDWYSSFMAFLSNISQDPDVIAWGMRTQSEFPEYILPIIRERRENPGDDLLSRLCTAEIDGARLTDDNIRSFVGLLLIAGGETTDKVIASIFKNLLMHPEQLDAVRGDRALITNALAETLRLSPPVNIVLRTAVDETRFSGGVVPVESIVACVVGAANHDERRFDRPDEFDIFRPDVDPSKAFVGGQNHLAFGSGRHFCVGAFLAKAEVECAVNQLLDAMPNVRLKDGIAPEDSGLFTRAPDVMELEFDV